MKSNCKECKNLPEGYVIEGHDHRNKKRKLEKAAKEFSHHITIKLK